MRLLLIHQNFPGQFRDLAPALLDRGHELKAIGCNERPTDPRMQIFRYSWSKPELNGGHNLTPEVDEWVRRGEAVARICEQLKCSGWAPDVILVHPGWGEALFVKDVFDAVPMVIWPELWLRPEHFGTEQGATLELGQRLYQRAKNWVMEAALAQCEAAVVPTRYQAKTFPSQWQGKIHVIHEGVRDDLASLPRLKQLTLSNTVVLTPDLPVVTFAARNLEPMRGYENFLRALAIAQHEMPDLHAVIAGSSGSSYSGESPIEGKSWKEIAEERAGKYLDKTRIHYTGHLAHSDLIKLFQRSNAHCYLSKSFVLSWSVLEAIACGTYIIADNNPMLDELATAGGKTILCNSKDERELAGTIANVARTNTDNVHAGQINKELLSNNCTNTIDMLLRYVGLGMF